MNKGVQRPSINSRLENMRNLSPAERLAVAAAVSLSDAEKATLSGDGALDIHRANGMIENVIGTFALPLGIATNFQVNGRDYLIPMAVEEPSVVAAASYMARIARSGGGFTTSSTAPVMRAQIRDPHGVRINILAAKDRIVDCANAKDAILVGFGGGCRDVEVHVFRSSPRGPMVIVHLLVDVREALIPLVAFGLPLSPVAAGPAAPLYNAAPRFTVDAATGAVNNLHNLLTPFEFLVYGLIGVAIAALIAYPFAMNHARTAAAFVSRYVSHEAIIGTFVGLVLVIGLWEGGLLALAVILAIGLVGGLLYRIIGFNTGMQFMGYYAALLSVPAIAKLFGG
ncbi:MULTISPECIES: hypothetical protein [unclassified Mesorhizobium]|uniref:hypothetical protein n=1 Tax=unclassified Mesorhizobium TaxID=325217 RepID=UPI00241646C2|nr:MULTISPECIES: hypothetical protein [unclassified Mesorhizobium]WFP66046.1 hypothetical protein QAZ47_14225 [Mesorhizobium sp. WSM4904]WFP79326.1 hypothetical protein QAZ22_14165 [Mesorhizobium sp. WSM4906]